MRREDLVSIEGEILSVMETKLGGSYSHILLFSSSPHFSLLSCFSSLSAFHVFVMLFSDRKDPSSTSFAFPPSCRDFSVIPMVP